MPAITLYRNISFLVLLASLTSSVYFTSASNRSSEKGLIAMMSLMGQLTRKEKMPDYRDGLNILRVKYGTLPASSGISEEIPTGTVTQIGMYTGKKFHKSYRSAVRASYSQLVAILALGSFAHACRLERRRTRVEKRATLFDVTD